MALIGLDGLDRILERIRRFRRGRNTDRSRMGVGRGWTLEWVLDEKALLSADETDATAPLTDCFLTGTWVTGEPAFR